MHPRSTRQQPLTHTENTSFPYPCLSSHDRTGRIRASGTRGLDYTLCTRPCWKMGTNNWTFLALLVVCYVGLAFTILRSLRQLSDLARRAASKRSSAVAAGQFSLVKFETLGYGTLFFSLHHHPISHLEAHPAQCPQRVADISVGSRPEADLKP